MRVAAEERQPVFPLGGNTGLCYGGVPESGDAEKLGIVLSLRRMHRIRDIDTVSDIITVDAGVILAEIHQAADGIGRQFPLRLGSEGSAQVGGLISTNAGDTAVVRYGPMRDLVAGLELALADGRIVNDLAALRKDNTGYMLRQLFIGAEGTLGIITGAALRLLPSSQRVRTPGSTWCRQQMLFNFSLGFARLQVHSSRPLSWYPPLSSSSSAGTWIGFAYRSPSCLHGH